MIDILTAGKIFLRFIYTNNIFPAEFVKILDMPSRHSVKNDTREILDILIRRDTYIKDKNPVLTKISENSNLLSPGCMGCEIYDWLDRNKLSMITLRQILNGYAHSNIAPCELETALAIFTQLIKTAPVDDSARAQAVHEISQCDMDAAAPAPVMFTPAKKPAATTRTSTGTIKRSERQRNIFNACQAHGLQLANSWMYATRNTRTDTYWFQPTIPRLNADLDVVLNDTKNHQLQILHIPANTLSTPPFRYRSDKSGPKLSIDLFPDTLRDRYTNISFSKYADPQKIPFTEE